MEQLKVFGLILLLGLVACKPGGPNGGEHKEHKEHKEDMEDEVKDIKKAVDDLIDYLEDTHNLPPDFPSLVQTIREKGDFLEHAVEGVFHHVQDVIEKAFEAQEIGPLPCTSLQLYVNDNVELVEDDMHPLLIEDELCFLRHLKDVGEAAQELANANVDEENFDFTEHQANIFEVLRRVVRAHHIQMSMHDVLHDIKEIKTGGGGGGGKREQAVRDLLSLLMKNKYDKN